MRNVKAIRRYPLGIIGLGLDCGHAETIIQPVTPAMVHFFVPKRIRCVACEGKARNSLSPDSREYQP